MTENNIKQNLSFHYLGLIASRSAYRFDRPFTDYGVDAVLEKVEKLNLNGTNRYVASGRTIDIQLKSTIESKVTRTADSIKFDLEVKNYNDLVRRSSFKNQTSTYLIPLVLIVFILPNNADDWLTIEDEGCTLTEGQAYWIFPDKSWNLSINKSSIRIQIPVDNKVDLNFCKEIFNLVHKR